MGTAWKLAPLVALVRSFDAELYRGVEVADALDTSTSTLRRLGLANWESLGPSQVEEVRGVRVWLYDMNRIEALAAHLASRPTRGGRPRVWDDQQRRVRRARHCAASYRRRRARELSAVQGLDGATGAQSRAEQLAAELDAMSALTSGQQR